MYARQDDIASSPPAERRAWINGMARVRVAVKSCRSDVGNGVIETSCGSRADKMCFRPTWGVRLLQRTAFIGLSPRRPSAGLQNCARDCGQCPPVAGDDICSYPFEAAGVGDCDGSSITNFVTHYKGER